MENSFTSRHFTVEKVKDGIYAAISNEGGGAIGNAGFIDLGNRTIVFDTFNTQQAAADLKNAAEKITNRPVTWVVNSHWHGDHIRGNQVFKESIIISSQMTYEKMKEIHPARIDKQRDDIQGLRNYIKSLEDKRESNNEVKLDEQISVLRELEISLPTLELVLPHQTYKNEITFYGTERHARLFTMGGGHSFCDAVLYLPEDKVIFMGDLLFVEKHPTFFEESSPENWIRILKEISFFDIQVFIPGHGVVGTKDDLLKVTDYIHENIKTLSAN